MIIIRFVRERRKRVGEAEREREEGGVKGGGGVAMEEAHTTMGLVW